MAQFKTYCYEIKVITNMHVGSGNANYGVIDNLVQRDPVTMNPTIHASSLKGALREFFEQVKPIDFVNEVFGSSPTEKKNLKNGSYRFLSADLFLLPVRSSHQQYYLATSQDIVKGIVEKLNTLNIKNIEKWKQMLEVLSGINADIKSAPAIFSEVDKTELEEMPVTSLSNMPDEVRKFNKLYDSKLSLWFEDDFKDLVKNLPVIARNQLENGQSANLWYEEIVPHQTRFITFISFPEDDNYFKDFNNILINSTIQIGANASVGYGLCKFIPLNPML